MADLLVFARVITSNDMGRDPDMSMVKLLRYDWATEDFLSLQPKDEVALKQEYRYQLFAGTSLEIYSKAKVLLPESGDETKEMDFPTNAWPNKEDWINFLRGLRSYLDTAGYQIGSGSLLRSAQRIVLVRNTSVLKDARMREIMVKLWKAMETVVNDELAQR
jgi:hypothetical protein